MTLGYDGKLYILAFDHRGSFQKKMFGIEGDPSEEQTATISDAKHLIFEGMVKAVEQGAEAGVTGVLVDEQFGAPKNIPGGAKERGLLRRAIVELQDAGVEADIWKIEGIDTQEDCRRIADTCRRDGRDGVVCVVLGRGANDEKVEHWLRQGAPVDGYAGFAIGRTIWWDALKGFLDGSVDRAAAADRIAENYLRFVEVYKQA